MFFTLFIIPRIAGIENNLAVLARMYTLNKNHPSNKQLLNRFTDQHMIRVMKNNAGVKITSINSAIKYSELYLNAFKNCEMIVARLFLSHKNRCLSLYLFDVKFQIIW